MVVVRGIDGERLVVPSLHADAIGRADRQGRARRGQLGLVGDLRPWPGDLGRRSAGHVHALEHRLLARGERRRGLDDRVELLAVGRVGERGPADVRGVDGALRGDLLKRLAAVERLIEAVVLRVGGPAPANHREHVGPVGVGHDRHRRDLIVIRRRVSHAGRIENLAPLGAARVVAEQAVVGRGVGDPVRVERQLIDRPRDQRVAGLDVADALEAGAVVGRAVDAGAVVAVLTGVGLSRAHPQRVVGRVDGQGADRKRRHPVEQRGPMGAAVGRAPHAAVGGAGEPGAVRSRDEGGGTAPHQPESGAGVGPERVRVAGGLGVVGLRGHLLPRRTGDGQRRRLAGRGDRRIARHRLRRRAALVAVLRLLVGEITVVGAAGVARPAEVGTKVSALCLLPGRRSV